MTLSVDETWQTLVRASVDRRHPWRVVGFCTASEQGPAARSVILRKVLPAQRQLVFFTDSRSEKMQHIARCEQVALLFWNPQHNLQLRATGLAAAEQDPARIESYWQSIPDHARRDYGSTDAPGVVLADPGQGGYDLAVARRHFVVLNVVVDLIDSLKLARDEHMRQRFEWSASTQVWQQARLVP